MRNELVASEIINNTYLGIHSLSHFDEIFSTAWVVERSNTGYGFVSSYMKTFVLMMGFLFVSVIAAETTIVQHPRTDSRNVDFAWGLSWSIPLGLLVLVLVPESGFLGVMGVVLGGAVVGASFVEPNE
ncbi:MAG: hypothetical protein V4534_06505 [Myxococcota bacterium]